MIKRCGTVALIGLPNSGKSSILNKLIGQKISPVTHKINTTRRVVNGVLTLSNKQFIFVDTPGVLNRNFVLKTDVFLWIANCKLKPEKPLTPLPQNLILILNKIDLFKKKSELLPVISNWQKLINPSDILLLSAKTGQGFDDFIKIIGDKLPIHEFMFDDKFVTDSTEKDLACELIREKVLLNLNEEIPYTIEVMIELFNEKHRNDNNKKIIYISAILKVKKDKHKPIVIGRNGTVLKRIGSAARKDLEFALDCKVMLRLLVTSGEFQTKI